MADNLLPEDILEEDEGVTADTDLENDDLGEDTESEEDTIYRYSAFFDFFEGDFLRTNTGDLKSATEAATWEQWCMKVIRTQRGVFEAYSDDIGIDFESAMSAESREETENILNREITDALLADPSGRTIEVGNITFEWSGDNCAVTVPVYGVLGNAEISANYQLSESEVT